MTRNVEAGLRDYRIEFIRESSFTEPGTDPSYLKYSPSIATFSWSSENEPASRRAIGNADPVDIVKASESHSFTVEYDMWNWLVDGSGNPNDAAYDGLGRDGDNLLPNSHTIVSREDKSDIPEEHTVDGASGNRATRFYSVGRGGLVDSVTITGEAEDAAIATVELEYMVHKARSFQIDQPNSSTQLCFDSTSASDTSQNLTIENEGAATAETKALNGTSLVGTASSFGDIDAINLDGDTSGNVKVYINNGTESSPEAGATLAEINGMNHYGADEGDLGVPALGSGSHESFPSNPSYQSFIGDNISRGGSTVKHDISSATVSAENNLEDMELTKSFGVSLFPGSRDLTMEATMFSEDASHDILMDHLSTTAEDIDWTLSDGTITLVDAVLTEPGSREVEEGQAVMTLDNTFTGQDLTIS